MADRVSIAIKRAAAIKTIIEESAVIAQQLNIEPPVILDRNRDPDYLQATQLEGVAAWLGKVSNAVAPKKAKTK